MLNMIAAIGRLTHTPELRTTTSGKEICSFDVACERSYSANGQRETDFLPCVAWGKTAQFISQYFDKGSMIAVNGSIQTRSYQDKQGSNRTKVEVLANNVSFCGAKAADKPAVRDFVQQTENYTSEAKASYSAPQAAQNFSQGSADDFAEITDDGDLPF